MAYVRQKANQLLIVQGERDRETGKVQQHVLFTLYSKAEALEAIGKTAAKRDWQFQRLLENQYPDIHFDWQKINNQIREKMGNLPDLWEYGDTRLRNGFRKSIVDFVRHLLLANPQLLSSSQELIREHVHELEYAREMIDFRLNTLKHRPSTPDKDTPFYWRYSLQGQYLSGDEEEYIEEMWYKGEVDKAEALFQLMVKCFEEYAEGYNYLGRIALEREDLEAALEHFSDAMHAGQKLFPKKLAKKDYWRDIKTRPYMRSLYNLIVTLNRMGEFDEALDFTQILDVKCGDENTARHYRTRILLNKGLNQDAFDCAEKGHKENAGEGFIAALAALEIGQETDAIAYFLHAALWYPEAARMVAGYKGRKPKTRDEVTDYNLGLELQNNLRWHFKKQGDKCRPFLKKII